MPEYNITLERRPNPNSPELGDAMFMCGTAYYATAPLVKGVTISPNEARRDAAIVFAEYWARAAREFQRICDVDPNGDTVPNEVRV